MEDTRLFAPFKIPYIWIFKDLTFGISLLAFVFPSFKTSYHKTDLNIVLLCFPIFSEITYFLNIGFVYWLLGMLVLLSNLAVLYKLLVIVIFGFIIDWHVGFSAYLVYASLILLLIKLSLELESLDNLTKYKMKIKNKFYFGILLIPMLLSEISLLMGFPPY